MDTLLTAPPHGADEKEPPSREYAAARGAAFALFSRLVASPFDPAFAGGSSLPDDVDHALGAIEDALPYACELGALAAAAMDVLEGDLARFAREYGALFEIGAETMPIPLREEVAKGDVKGPQAKEEVVRYYSLFGYELAAERQWAPDHLSVELEFVHFLCFREGEAGSDEDARPYALAQRDFVARHLLEWLAALRGALLQREVDPYFKVLFATLHDWLATDLAWRRETLDPEAAR